MRPSKSICVSAVAACLTFGVGLPSQAQVNFNFNYLDAPGVGFNDVTAGADRKAGLNQAASYISGILGPAYSANIFLDVVGSQTNDTTLASASSKFTSPGYPGDGFTGAGDVMLKILNGDGADPSPGVADGDIDWNFEDFAWEPLSDFQPGELDLISTATHEMTHALGFASDIAQNGDSTFGDSPGTASAWSPFDEFVAFTDGTSIIDSSGVLDGTKWNAASVGGAGLAGLQFNGPNAVAAAGGDPVFLYSPTSWEDGSSGSHLDTEFYQVSIGQIENMMNHEASVLEGLDIRAYTAIELGILKDIGYTQLIAVLAGDYNNDGFVSQADLDLVLLNWGDASVPAEWLAADQFDGVQVSQNELDGVLLNWGNGVPPVATPVPEPSTFLTVLCAMGIVLRRSPIWR